MDRCMRNQCGEADPIGLQVLGGVVGEELQVEVVELSEATLEDGRRLDAQFANLGGWIASALVKLNDLDLKFLPDDAPEDR